MNPIITSSFSLLNSEHVLDSLEITITYDNIIANRPIGLRMNDRRRTAPAYPSVHVDFLAPSTSGSNSARPRSIQHPIHIVPTSTQRPFGIEEVFFPTHLAVDAADSEAGMMYVPVEVFGPSRLYERRASHLSSQRPVPINRRRLQAALNRTTLRYKYKALKTDGAAEECTICVANLKANDNVRRLPCLHLFHLRCIDRWLQRSRNCPICRADVESLGVKSASAGTDSE